MELFTRIVIVIGELLRAWNGYSPQTLAVEGDDFFNGFVTV